MKKSLIVVSLAALLLVGVVVGAIAQDGVLAGLVQPLVVDIEQVVPAEVMVAVPVSEGEFVTVTTPITVNVALRVSIDGPQVVTVEPLLAEEAAVSIEGMMEEGDGEAMIDENGLAYEIESSDNVEVLQIQSIPSSMGMQFVAEVENVGDSTMDYVQIVVSLYDADDNLLDVASGYAAIESLDAGQTSPATVLSMVDDPGDVVRYFVQAKE